jgi:prepilin-type N-terminal cleavage/methylation domain-containing protein
MKDLLTKRKSSGFTIIEVMIVLAIAGLIMVIVFIAVPQLQRQQRNNARQNVLNRVVTEANNYASNNQGAIPTANNNAQTGFVGVGGGFYTRYIAGNAAQFNDPQTGAIMTFNAWTSDAAVAGGNNATVWYATGRICNGEASQAGQARQFIVMAKLEGGAIYCQDNQ